MKPDEAHELFDRLCAYYDRSPREAARDAWLTELRTLDYLLGSQAVRSLVVTSKFWPSVAELYEQVVIVREQAGRERREQERRDADAAYDQLPRPKLREIPDLLAAAGKADDAARMRHWLGATVAGLPVEGRGPCDDCGDDREHTNTWRVGEFRLCQEHAKQHLRAQARLLNESSDEAAA